MFRPLRIGWRCAVVRTGFSRFLIIAVIWRSATWRSVGVFAFFWSLHQYHDHGHKNMKTRPRASPRKSRDIELSEEQQEREGKSEDAISTPRQSRAVFAAIRSDRRTSRRTLPSMGTTLIRKFALQASVPDVFSGRPATASTGLCELCVHCLLQVTMILLQLRLCVASRACQSDC